MGGRDISSSAILPLLVEKQLITKQAAPKHSTPIQRTPKPNKILTVSLMVIAF